jgi:hypothetical protein
MGARRKASFVTLAVAAAVALTASAALADGIRGDADDDSISPPFDNTLVANQGVGTTVEYSFSLMVVRTGLTSTKVFANPSDTVQVDITRTGQWLAAPAGSPSDSFTLSNYLENGTGTIAITVPPDACGRTQTMHVSLVATASNGRALSPNTESMDYTITGVGLCGSADTDRDGIPDNQDNCPTIANHDQADADNDGIGDLCDYNAFPPAVGDQATPNPVTGPEGSKLEVTGSFTDGDGTINFINQKDGKGGTIDNLDNSWYWSYRPTDSGSGTVDIATTDTEHTTVDSFTWEALNVPPTADISNSGPIDEDGTATVSLTNPFDPSSDDTAAGFHYAFSCDGSPLPDTYAAADQSNTATCSFSDSGPNSVTGRIFDKDDGYTEYTTTVPVHNVSPIADISNDGPIDEGGTATVSLTNPFDPSSADTTAGFHYGFSCDGSPLPDTYTAAGTSSSTSCSFSDNGSYTVTGRIFDKDDGFTEYTTTVHVRNAAPTADISNSGPIDEGGVATVSLTNPFDPSSDDTTAGFHYAFSCDGSALPDTYGAADTSNTTTCSFGDNGSYTVTGRIFDKDDGYTEYTTTVHVPNVAPSADISNSGPIDEGGSATVSLTNPVDPSSDDTTAGFHYAFSCDGSALPDTYAAAGTSSSTSCSFVDSGAYPVTGRIFDKDDGYTEYTTTVHVRNVAPTADISNDGPIDEGGSATVSLTNPVDPSSDDTTAGFHYAFSCDGSALPDTYADAGTSNSTTCTFDDNGSYLVTGRIFDKDDGYSEYTTTVQVGNVAPTITDITSSGTTGASCLGDDGATMLGFAWSDPAGTHDTYSYDVDWGDGSPHATGIAVTSPVSGLSHAYGAGSFTISIVVSDEDGGSSLVAQVPVTHTGLQTTGLSSSLSGRTSFKLGSTIPVTLQVLDCSGAPIGDLLLHVHLGPIDGGEAVVAPSGASSGGDLMQFNGGQYQYNLSTKLTQLDGHALTPGTYHLWVTGAGVSIDGTIDLR